MSFPLSLVAATALLSCATAFAADPPRYTLQLLTDLPGGATTSQGMALNAQGAVAGQSAASDGHLATLWAAPSRTPMSLGDLPGGSVSSMAYGLNDAGTSVGTAYGTNGLRAYRRLAEGAMLDLGDLPGGSSASGAYAVNNSGVAVGYGYNTASGSNPVAVMWDVSGGAIVLGDLPGNSYMSTARAINDAGVVAGISMSTKGRQAFMWTAETGMLGLGDLPGAGTNAEVLGINEAGWIVGYDLSAAGSQPFHATLWRDGEVIDLGSANRLSYAYDVNNRGQIVGQQDNRATLFGTGHAPIDLQSLVDDLPAGYTLGNAMAINDAGQITGWGERAGVRVGFVLTEISAVPEPGAWALMLSGLLATGRIARRRRNAAP